ncbi:MAG: hypothetical protein OJF49_000101 [Ktedonobacterales bacterium]|nr:MAG: hypothetical protein OJF49_000101 [Ktedonobacterales bacterium]
MASNYLTPLQAVPITQQYRPYYTYAWRTIQLDHGHDGLFQLAMHLV